MITSSEKVGNGLAKLTIELSVEELRREYGRAAKRISSRTRIPGFRPGKAPVTVVENMYGKTAIINEAVGKLVPDSYANALRAADLFAVDQPEIAFVDDEDITFEKPVVNRTTRILDFCCGTGNLFITYLDMLKTLYSDDIIKNIIINAIFLDIDKLSIKIFKLKLYCWIKNNISLEIDINEYFNNFKIYG